MKFIKSDLRDTVFSGAKMTNVKFGQRAAITGHTDRVLGIAISSNGKHIVSCSADRSIRIWDFATRKEYMKL